MAFTRNIKQNAGSDDADYYINSFNNNRTYLWWGSHSVDSFGPWTGLRFPVPDDIDPDDITNVVLRLYANNSATFNTIIRVEQSTAQAWADNATDRPKERWTAIGSTNEVPWNVAATAGNYYNSPDISASVKTALSGLGSGDYLGVIGGINIAAGVELVQMMSADHGTEAYRPELIITYEPPPQDANITTTAPSLGVTSSTPITYKVFKDISYHDGIGDSYRRVLDIYQPFGTPPSSGWPTILFIHGGAFAAGSKEDIAGSERYLGDTFDSGYALVAISYKLTNGDLFANTVTGYTNPSAIQDASAALKFIETNKATYSFDTGNLVSTSYSAGGHIALMLALLLEDENRNTYEATYQGYNTALGKRYPDYPELDYFEGRTGLPSFKGLYSMSGAVNLDDVYTLNILIRSLIKLYFGQKPNNSYPALSGEGNVDDYIEGKAGTIYAAKTGTAPQFPIAWTYTTNDTTVPEAAGYTALYNALNAVGFDVSQTGSNGTVASGKALSVHSYYDGYFNGGGHDGMFATYSSTFFKNFLTEVKNQVEQSRNGTDFFPFF